MNKFFSTSISTTFLVVFLLSLFACKEEKKSDTPDDHPLTLIVVDGSTPLNDVEVYLNDSTTPIGSTDIKGILVLPSILNTQTIRLTKNDYNDIGIALVKKEALLKLKIGMYLSSATNSTDEVVYGKVKDGSNEGVQSVTVTANGKSTVTNMDGSYEIQSLRGLPGVYSMTYAFSIDEISFNVNSTNPEEEITIFVDDGILIEDSKVK